jgi:hypothetical protein
MPWAVRYIDPGYVANYPNSDGVGTAKYLPIIPKVPTRIFRICIPDWDVLVLMVF